MNRRRRMLSSNLCCRFETVLHCEKKRSTSPPEVGCVIKNSTLSWNGEGARDCHHSCKAVGPFISTTLQRMYRLHCSAISGTSDMHMQTCKHAGMKKTKKAKVKRPKKRWQPYCVQLGLNPRPWNYSAVVLPIELYQVLVTMQHLRVYGIVKKKNSHCSAPAWGGGQKIGKCEKLRKNCGKIAENCEKLRKIAKNCKIAENCEKLRTSISPPPC